MTKSNSRIVREKVTVAAMITLYCRGRHKTVELCPDCQTLLHYARSRLVRCRFGEDKPVCRRCRIHCYQPEMRERIKTVMRYAGPRLIFHQPVLALRHLIDGMKRPPAP